MKASGIKLIICGLNGAGKSTFGRALARATGFKFADIENYYFSPDDVTYTSPKNKSEVCKMLLDDLKANDNFILSAVKGDYGEAVCDSFNLAVFLNVPKDIRMKRVRERSRIKFGNRILPGGDLYEKESSFFDTAEKRSDDDVLNWLKRHNIPTITLDGTKNISENINIMLSEIERRAKI